MTEEKWNEDRLIEDKVACATLSSRSARVERMGSNFRRVEGGFEEAAADDPAVPGTWDATSLHAKLRGAGDCRRSLRLKMHEE